MRDDKGRPIGLWFHHCRPAAARATVDVPRASSITNRHYSERIRLLWRRLRSKKLAIQALAVRTVGPGEARDRKFPVVAVRCLLPVQVPLYRFAPASTSSG